MFSSFLDGSLCFAKELEVSLPGLPTTGVDLPVYIQYFFKFGMMAAGVIALIVLIVGGIKYLTSAGNPDAISDARKRIFSGIIGLVILLLSYLVIDMINPQLKDLKIVEQIMPVPGVFLSDAGDTIKEPCPPVVSVKKIKPPYTKIIWPSNACDPTNPHAAYHIYFFKDTTFKEIVDFKRIECTEQKIIPNSSQAFWIQKETPGVYFYPNDDCTPGKDEMSFVYTTSVSNWGKTWPIKSMRVVQGPSKQSGPFFGAILQNWTDYRSLTQASALSGSPFFYHTKAWEINAGDSRCLMIPSEITAPPHSITIYTWVGYTDDTQAKIASAGDGITLYTRANWTGGSYNLKDSYLREDKKVYRMDLSGYSPNYLGTNVPEDEQEKCKWFFDKNVILPGGRDCLKSIKIEGGGNYLVFFLSSEVMVPVILPPLIHPQGALQRFPISTNIIPSNSSLYYDIYRGPLDLDSEWINNTVWFQMNITNLNRYLFIIPLAERI